jgi:hypothetical protein
LIGGDPSIIWNGKAGYEITRHVLRDQVSVYGMQVTGRGRI